MAPTICTKPISPFFSSKTNFVFFFYLHGSVLFLTNMKYCFDAQHSMSTQRFAKYPSPCKLDIGVLGYLFVDIGFETALEALFKQVLLSLASSALENLYEKCASCSFNSSTPDSRLSRTVEGGRLHRLWLKSIFKSAESSATRRGQLEIGLSRT